MRKNGLLNTELIKVISAIGHTQYIVVGDAGLPIPKGVSAIDLALKPGTPSFLETLQAILGEMVVEHYFLADEIKEKNSGLLQKLETFLPEKECSFISHERLKEMSTDAMVIVRTGETSPYANIVIVAGVNF